ncbi:MAG: OmpH family outer membrane protein [Arsenophonus sp.]|nr:MAG: OmpH family outer membrane protein [Arsenophonus sp.]
MKNIFFIISFFLLSHDLYAVKIAVMNTAEVFEKLPIRREIFQEIQKKFEIRIGELQKMEDDLKNQAKELQKNNSLSYDKDIKEFEQKRIDFINKAKKIEEDNQKYQQEESFKIFKMIQVAIKEIALKDGYDIVIDVNGIQYNNKKEYLNNITNKVIQQVQ